MSQVFFKKSDGTVSGSVCGVNKDGKIVSMSSIILSIGESQTPVSLECMLASIFPYLMHPIRDSSGIITGKMFLTLSFLVLGLKRYSENCMNMTGFFGIALTNFERLHSNFQDLLIKMIEFSWGSDCLERFYQWFYIKYQNRKVLIETISTVLSVKWNNLTQINFNKI